MPNKAAEFPSTNGGVTCLVKHNIMKPVTLHPTSYTLIHKPQRRVHNLDHTPHLVVVGVKQGSGGLAAVFRGGVMSLVENCEIEAVTRCLMLRLPQCTRRLQHRKSRLRR